jgi:hypothetical protein
VIIAKLRQFVCPECSFILGAIDVFGTHMKTHGRHVCMICWQTGRFLPADVPIFPKFQYHTHLSQQHPRCLCCEFKAFDPVNLSEHMSSHHFRCQICPTIRWFKDASDLIQHHQREHFVCHYPECSSEHFIAFPSRGELMLHLQSVHKERHAETTLADFEDDHRREEVEAAEAKARRRELNQRFMAKLSEVFRKNPQTSVNLQAEAQRFMQGGSTPEEFYEKFSEICGTVRNQIFTDMVAILPDPQKRAALLRIHEAGGPVIRGRGRRSRGRGGRGGLIFEWRSEERPAEPPPPPPPPDPVPPSPHSEARPPPPKQKTKGKKVVVVDW